MPFRFAWKDDSRRVMCYIAEGNWNWRDYHHAARASTFTLSAVDHPVDRLIDLRASSRARLPAGMSAHVRSFTRQTQACLTGRALVIGLPDCEAIQQQLGADQSMPTAEGFVKFVDDEPELERLLSDWAANPPARYRSS